MTASLDSRHVKILHDRLDEIPGLYADLPAVLTGIHGHGGGAHRPPSSRPPLSLAVVDALDLRVKGTDEWRTETDPRGREILDRYGIIPRLGLWVRIIDEGMDAAGEHVLELDDPDWTNLAALCSAIKTATPWLLGQDWARQLAADVDKIWTLLRDLLGIRPEYRPKCRNVWCGTTLEPMDRGTWYSCPGCGRDYKIDADLEALGAAQYLKAEDVAQLLDVAYSTIRYWKTEGWIKPIQYTTGGVALYDLDRVRTVRDTPAEQRIKLPK